MYLLTEWEGWTGKYLAQGAGVRTERHDHRAYYMTPGLSECSLMSLILIKKLGFYSKKVVLVCILCALSSQNY